MALKLGKTFNRVKNFLPVASPSLWYAPLIDNAGKTGVGPRVGGLNESGSGYQDIINKINEGAGKGTYGEGVITIGVQELKKLQDQFRSGKISSSDYAAITDAIVPSLNQAAQSLLRGGSRSADAANAAGAQDLFKIANDYNVLKASREILGRDVTAQDIDAIRPWFEGGDTEGRSYLTELKKQEASSPEALRKRAGAYSGQVGNIFQDLLKRGASQQEIDHFGSLLASGDVDEYTLRSFVQQLPEYRTAEDKRFREGLSGELEGYDREAFGKAKEDVISRYARAGIQNSSALDFALTSLMGDIAKERNRYLTGLSTEQYGGNKALARADYEGNLNQYLSNRDYEKNRSYNTMQDYLGRGRERADYDRQMQDYNRMLQSIPRQRGSRYADLGALIGFGVGAATGNPLLAMAGTYAGRAGGGFFD